MEVRVHNLYSTECQLLNLGFSPQNFIRIPDGTDVASPYQCHNSTHVANKVLGIVKINRLDS